MCTVTYVPGLPGGGFLLATNRDESHRRGAARPPRPDVVGGVRILAPRDADAGGTWIAADEGGRVVCLLNGDTPPARQPPADPPSRGRLVLELIEDARADAVAAALADRAAAGRLPFRPFKLVVAEPGGDGGPGRLLQARWDGERVDLAESVGPALVVSSTFDREEVARRRARAWDAFLARRPREPADLAAALASFHASHGGDAADGDAYSVCMHRQDARTVSSTLVSVAPEGVAMEYRAGWPCRGGPTVAARLEGARRPA